MSVYTELACGAFAGVASVSLTYPADTVKTRIQAGMFRGVKDCIMSTWKIEGIRGFYRGFPSQIISQPLYVGSAFAGLAFGKAVHDACAQPTKLDLGITPKVAASEKDWLSRLLVGSVVAGLLCSTVVTPFERLRVLMQATTGKHARGELELLRSVVRANGLGTLYRGWAACTVREVPGCAIWFGTYEGVTGYLMEENICERPSAVLFGGAAAGAAFWTTLLPVERIKIIQQHSATSSASMLSVAKEILRTSGPRGFFVGFGIVLARGVAFDVISFCSADALRRKLETRAYPDLPVVACLSR
mmetsp:Transcript_75436/g.151654  ORF Transcript_75436/g.151654 Transcript_75436/m.151654 type:complete len:302 (+) Transcript_75436:280-1185(+)